MEARSDLMSTSPPLDVPTQARGKRLDGLRIRPVRKLDLDPMRDERDHQLGEPLITQLRGPTDEVLVVILIQMQLSRERG